MQLELITDRDAGDNSQLLTVYIPERDFAKSIRNDHPHFKQIKRLAYDYDRIQEGDDEGKSRPLTDEENQALIDLFDVQEAINRRFQRLGERYVMKNGILHKDNDPMDENDPWVKQVMAFVRQGVEDYVPLIKFQEKLDANPNEHSREQFYNFLSHYPFTITTEGDVVLYKGVYRRSTGKDIEQYPFESTTAGPNTIVDDVEQPNGRIKQGIGAVVEHPRRLVHFNPRQACSNGLHCGAHSYAAGYGNTILRVIVNPRDVVNVPSNDHKVRVCRYKVLDVAERNYQDEALLVIDTVATKDVDPSEPPYVPAEATYDDQKGDCPQEAATEPTDAQSASDDLAAINDDQVSEFYCFGCLEEHEGDCDDPEPVLPPEPEELPDDLHGEPEPGSTWAIEAEMLEEQERKPRKRYPSPAKWDEIQAERKIRKKGIRTLAAREGWVLDNEDEPNERKSWVIPPKS